MAYMGHRKSYKTIHSCFWGFGFFVKSFIKNCPPPPDLLPVLLLNTCDSRKRRKVWSEVGSEECGERRRVECGVRLILMTASWGSQNFCQPGGSLRLDANGQEIKKKIKKFQKSSPGDLNFLIFFFNSGGWDGLRPGTVIPEARIFGCFQLF